MSECLSVPTARPIHTLAIIACFVEPELVTFSIFTPFRSSSIRPSVNAVFTRVANFLASRARFRLDDEGSDPALVASVNLSASCSNRSYVATIEHLRHMQSVSTSRRV